MTAIASFIERAWNDHVSDLPAVMARFGEGFALLEEAPTELNGFLQLAEHLHIVHHGDAAGMQAVLDRTASLLAAQPEAVTTVDKARLSMQLLREESTAGVTLPLPATIRAHGSAVCGFASRGETAKARRLLQATASLARDADAAARSDATRAWAASCNNLATLLLDIPRSKEADALMLEAAASARSAWGEVGTWLNVERADYVVSICHAAVGDGAKATEHAQSCAAICEANAADAFERFFAHEAMAKALLAQGHQDAAQGEARRMEALLADIVDDGNRAYARSVLASLPGA